MDANEARSIFDRENYLQRAPPARRATPPAKRSSANWTPTSASNFALCRRVDYYLEQTGAVKLIKILGSFLAATMSIGAVFAAMNTMYAAVGARTREIGTLRVLGYRRKSILAGFLIEGSSLALIGGVLGCASLLSLTAGAWEPSASRHSANRSSISALHQACRARAGVLGSRRPGWKLAAGDPGGQTARHLRAEGNLTVRRTKVRMSSKL